jgi:hypothetical protein
LNRKDKTFCIGSIENLLDRTTEYMNLLQIADALDAELQHGPSGWGQIVIHSVFASDLMSDVLMSDRDEMLLITSLSTEQSVRSAGIVGAEAIIIANDKTVTEGMIELAKEQDIPLLSISFPKYESCIRLGRILDL